MLSRHGVNITKNSPVHLGGAVVSFTSMCDSPAVASHEISSTILTIVMSDVNIKKIKNNQEQFFPYFFSSSSLPPPPLLGRKLNFLHLQYAAYLHPPKIPPLSDMGLPLTAPLTAPPVSNK